MCVCPSPQHTLHVYPALYPSQRITPPCLLQIHLVGCRASCECHGLHQVHEDFEPVLEIHLYGVTNEEKNFVNTWQLLKHFCKVSHIFSLTIRKILMNYITLEKRKLYFSSNNSQLVKNTFHTRYFGTYRRDIRMTIN